jgi:hypothetical protein
MPIEVSASDLIDPERVEDVRALSLFFLKHK